MTLPPVILRLALQWAEDDDPALAAARSAWDQLDQVAIWALVLLGAAVFLVSAVLLFRQKSASLRRRLISVGVLLGGCGFFCLVVARMGVVWLVADPMEAGGPPLGSSTWFGWAAWLGGATLLGVASLVGSFIIVGAEEL